MEFKEGDRVILEYKGDSLLATVVRDTREGKHPVFVNADVIFDRRPDKAVHVNKHSLRLATPEDEVKFKVTDPNGHLDENGNYR